MNTTDHEPLIIPYLDLLTIIIRFKLIQYEVLILLIQIDSTLLSCLYYFAICYMLYAFCCYLLLFAICYLLYVICYIYPMIFEWDLFS